MDKEKEILIRAFKDNKSLLKPIFELNFQKFTKPSDISEQYRKKGNELYTSTNHSHAVHFIIFCNYCQSIATAPSKSETLALAYANKSVLLLHLEKYEDCIKDIDRTLTFAKSRTMKVKLLCRKVECMKKLGLECRNVVDDAKHYLNKIDEEDRKAYSKLIKKVEALPSSVNNECQEKDTARLPEEDITIGGFAIQCNETDGRHLVATKDYQPGDVILVEKLFVTTVDSDKNNVVCQYCLKTCWSSVPCEKCSWAMFCSDDCKEMACQEFHDIECSLIPYLKVVNDSWGDYHLSIRTLIIGIKTASSVADLKDELKSVNRDTDVSFKGYFKDGEFVSDSIQNVFLLNCDRELDDKLESMSLLSLMTLIGLVKHTTLLEDISLKDIDDLVKNDDLLFLGSLLLKLIVLQSVNNCLITHLKQIVKLGALCFAPLSGLVKHSCAPNAGRCFAEDRKVIIVYALRPIETGSQIVMNHFDEFYNVPLKQRIKAFEKSNVTCNCQACCENWPPLLHLSKKSLKKLNYAISTDVEKEVYEDFKSISEVIENKKSASVANIKKLSRAIQKAANVKYPSYLTSLLAEAMNHIYFKLYSNLKPQAMKNCNGEKGKTESSKSAAKKSLP